MSKINWYIYLGLFLSSLNSSNDLCSSSSKSITIPLLLWSANNSSNTKTKFSHFIIFTNYYSYFETMNCKIILPISTKFDKNYFRPIFHCGDKYLLLNCSIHRLLVSPFINLLFYFFHWCFVVLIIHVLLNLYLFFKCAHVHC